MENNTGKQTPSTHYFKIKPMLFFDTLHLFAMNSFGSDSFLLASTVFFATIISIFLLLKIPKMKIPVPGIPCVPSSHWFFGHSQIFNNQDFQQAWWKLCFEHANEEGLCSFWNFSRPAITVNTVEHARVILTASSTKPPLQNIKKHTRMLLGEKSILFKDGKEWKHHRSLYAKALSNNVVFSMLDPIRDVVTSLVLSLKRKIDVENQGKPIEMNIETLVQLVLADVSGKTFFGMDFKCCEKLEQIPITKAIRFVGNELGRRIASPFNPAAQFYGLPSAYNRRHRESMQFVRNTLKDIIEERKLALSSSSITNDHDFITNVLKNSVSEESGDLLNVDEIIHALMTVHLGSYDTTTSSLVYIFYCLACHADAEEKCLEEIKRSLETHDTLNPDDLPYCNAVVTETIRLYPAIVAISRTLEKPLKLEKVTVPAGMDVLIPFWHIQRDERNFPRALEFLPERWVKQKTDGSWVGRSTECENEDNTTTNEDLSDSAASFSSDDTTLPGLYPDKQHHINKRTFDNNGMVSPADKKCFLAFSAGGRSCVGSKLAKKEICIILVELLRNFKFELVPGFRLNLRCVGIFLKSVGGVPMIISKRN